jgi:small GTP-binding protein
VVLLGDTNTGKTSLVVRFVSGHYPTQEKEDGAGTTTTSNTELLQPTIGAFFVTKRVTCVQHNMICKLLLWDTAGQEQYTKFASTYYQNAAAAILTYDVSQPNTIQRLSFWLDELHRTITARGERRIVLCVAACKCDVLHQNHHHHTNTTDGTSASATTSSNDATRTQQQQQQQMQYQYALEEGQRLSQQYSALFVQTSAKDNMGISFLFEQLCARVLQCQMEYETAATTTTTTASTSLTAATTNNSSSTTNPATTTINPNHLSVILPIPVNVVSTTTTTSNTPTNQNRKKQQQQLQQRLPISPSLTNAQRKFSIVTNSTATTTTMTNRSSTHANSNNVQDESEDSTSHTLPTQDVITSSSYYSSNNNNRNMKNVEAEDDILMRNPLHTQQQGSTNSGTDHNNGVPTYLRRDPNKNRKQNNNSTKMNDDDQSYGTNYSSVNPAANNNNTLNPICGDATAFVCGADKNASYCTIM